MAKTQRFLTFFTFLFAIISISAQIKIKELPSYDLLQVDSLFFDINQSREILSLRSNWEVYSPAAPERKAVVSIPSTFSGEESLVYERLFFVSRNQVNNKTLTLHFLGVDYTADVLLNDLVIYKHPGGIQPFDVKLPSDILKPDEENKLTVNINFELDDINTIPVLQRFLFPASRGGIISDVYLAISNKIFINKLEISPNVDANLETASIKIRSFIQNDQKKYVSIPEELSEYKLNYSLKTPSGEQKYSNSLENLLTNEISESTFEIKLNNPVLWSPNNPQYYVLETSITLNDSLIDLTAKRFSLYDISIEEDALKLNGNRFQINGTTYFYSENESGGLISYKKLQNDLKLIKETGFNTVRFAKVLPPLYALDICQSLGLFVLVELPLNSIPDEILTSNDFSSRVSNHLHLMIEKYSEYSSVLGFGLGGGYLGKSYDQYDFINSQAEIIKSNCDKLSYVSFVSLPASKISSLDLAGIELFSAAENQLSDLASELNKIDYQVFISEATYPSFNGSSNGYLNQNSYEAAAKYFSDIIDFSSSNKLNGFVLNSFFDYRGDYKSFYAGYNEEYYYSIGLLPNAETIDRISYKVVKSKLTNTEKITIPIGSTKDDSPILFVIIGLILSLFMALLINSKRKFREDASRALIRPYNFFADIRDHRLLSGIQTIFLMFILAGSFALLIINLLYYLRTNLFLEKILLAFGSQNLIDAVIYLAWHPLDGFLILFAVSIIGIILLSMVIKIFSFFLKNKVFFSSIFYTTIWSFLPLSLLLPVELVLYRILAADIVNLYLYIVIALYLLWQVQRLFKGIHVIFDIKPSKVNLYGLAVIIIVVVGILLYYQFANSTVYHLIRAVTEYKFL